MPLPATSLRAGAPLGALARANLRFWPTVAPAVADELARWDAPARAITDVQLRVLAHYKLTHERFNAEVAATLATLAPRRERPRAIRAIVALEVLFDYLDGRTELPAQNPLTESERLFKPFVEAVAPPSCAQQDTWPTPVSEPGADEPYVHGLAARVRESFLMLPSAMAVSTAAHEATRRCAGAQMYIHAADRLGDGALEEWARTQATGSGLEWREYLGGSASSVLAAHALIALASLPHTTPAQAERTDAAYLAIAGVITMLDSLVDHSSDTARGEKGFIELFATQAELQERLIALTREALVRAREAPYSAHHVMTFAGVVAYYTSHPGAREPHARAVVALMRRELAPTVWATLAVMHTWRVAKELRERAQAQRRRSCASPWKTPNRMGG